MRVSQERGGLVAAFLRDERGQGMTEYVILGAWTILTGVLLINKGIIPPLNELYQLVANVVFMPFP